jgi:hypothetical protein
MKNPHSRKARARVRALVLVQVYLPKQIVLRVCAASAESLSDYVTRLARRDLQGG